MRLDAREQPDEVIEPHIYIHTDGKEHKADRVLSIVEEMRLEREYGAALRGMREGTVTDENFLDTFRPIVKQMGFGEKATELIITLPTERFFKVMNGFFLPQVKGNRSAQTPAGTPAPGPEAAASPSGASPQA